MHDYNPNPESYIRYYSYTMKRPPIQRPSIDRLEAPEGGDAIVEVVLAQVAIRLPAVNSEACTSAVGISRGRVRSVVPLQIGIFVTHS